MFDALTLLLPLDVTSVRFLLKLPVDRNIDFFSQTSVRSLYDVVLVIILTRAAPALQYHFLLFFFFSELGLLFTVFLLAAHDHLREKR